MSISQITPGGYSWLPAAYVVIAVLAGCIVALSAAYVIIRVLDYIKLCRLHYAAMVGADRVAEKRRSDDRRVETEIERMISEIDEVDPGYRPGDGPRWF